MPADWADHFDRWDRMLVDHCQFLSDNWSLIGRYNQPCDIADHDTKDILCFVITEVLNFLKVSMLIFLIINLLNGKISHFLLHLDCATLSVASDMPLYGNILPKPVLLLCHTLMVDNITGTKCRKLFFCRSFVRDIEYLFYSFFPFCDIKYQRL